MRFIANNKIYDTDKAELLCTGKKQWELKTSFGILCPTRETTLYKTAKGSYFFTSKGDYDQYHIEVTNEEIAKRFLVRNNYDKYAELFGELEEA